MLDRYCGILWIMSCCFFFSSPYFSLLPIISFASFLISLLWFCSIMITSIFLDIIFRILMKPYQMQAQHLESLLKLKIFICIICNLASPDRKTAGQQVSSDFWPYENGCVESRGESQNLHSSRYELLLEILFSISYRSLTPKTTWSCSPACPEKQCSHERLSKKPQSSNDHRWKE